MRVFTIAILLAALVAGCLGSNSPSEGPGDAGSPAFAKPLQFLPPVDLNCPTEGVSVIFDQLGDCGQFGEPVIEVAGDGAIWASATCCVGRSPPIWVSRDGGESFDLLPFADRTGVVRDGFGIEGDFGIDDAGNVYFFDIAAATTWFSKYQADGTHVFTKADIFPPLVDRPWVRGGVADEVWVFYNTGFATNLYHSTNGGLTWSLTAVGFDCGLMTIGQGPVRDRLFVTGCPSEPKLWISENGGTSFGAPIVLPVPDQGFPKTEFKNGTRTSTYQPPVSDEAGNIYVPFTYAMDRDGHRVGIYVDIVHPDGSIAGPFLVSADIPWNSMPWGGAGTAGHFGVAWYGADATVNNSANATWSLYVAATTNGDSTNPTFQLVKADPDPVLLNRALGRNLGDFLEADVGPDGRFYVIYARRGEDNVLVNRVVISDGTLDFGKGVPYNGPQPAASQAKP